MKNLFGWYFFLPNCHGHILHFSSNFLDEISPDGLNATLAVFTGYTMFILICENIVLKFICFVFYDVLPRDIAFNKKVIPQIGPNTKFEPDTDSDRKNFGSKFYLPLINDK